MAKPISAVPQIFATATSPLPLANLDSDFAYVVTKLNDLATYSNYVADSGTLNAIVLNFPAGVVLSGLNVGLSVQFKPANTNTGTVTLQVKLNGVNVGSAATVVDAQGNALTSGLLKNTVIYTAVYDGTNWVVQGVLQAASTLPSYAGNALKYLQVNSGETDVNWAVVPDELPSLTGNALKSLRVNSGETAPEWYSAGAIVPSATGQNGRLLMASSASPALPVWSNIVEVSFSTTDYTLNVVSYEANKTTNLYLKSQNAGLSAFVINNTTYGEAAYFAVNWASGLASSSLAIQAPRNGGISFITQTYLGSTPVTRVDIDVDGNLSVLTAGTGFKVKEGSNAKQGTAVLSGGTVTVSNTSVTANSRIFLTSQVDGGTPGFLRVSSRSAGNSFTITSSSGTDTSTVAYIIFEPA